MAKKAKPFLMHALSKASATHLHKQGHISKQKHNEIVKHADKNMTRLRNKAKAAAPAPLPMAPKPMAPAPQAPAPGVIPTPPPGFESDL
jgi:hypothetical protein